MAITSGSTTYAAWGLSETYDRYGNRPTQSVTAGTGPGGAFTISASHNQITTGGFSYDAAGNLITGPVVTTTYTYDHEECNTGFADTASTGAYTCDANGMRVQKVVTGTDAVTTVYVRSGGQVIAEYDNGATVASPTREYIYGNNVLAIVTGSAGGSGGTMVYQHRDHVSPRLFTNSSGADIGEQGTFPFGESWYSSSQSGGLIFTTYERDAESGNDYALARSYANTQGRFLAPDPLSGQVGDPQSWNRYAYVENDPINVTDPSGQGIWEDLGFAVVDVLVAIFDAPALGAVLEAESSAEAGQANAQVMFCFPSCPTPSAGGTGGSRGENTGPGTGPDATDSSSTGNCPTGCSPGDSSLGGPGAGNTDPEQTGATGQGPGGQGPGGQGMAGAAWTTYSLAIHNRPLWRSQWNSYNRDQMVWASSIL